MAYFRASAALRLYKPSVSRNQVLKTSCWHSVVDGCYGANRSWWVRVGTWKGGIGYDNIWLMAHLVMNSKYLTDRWAFIVGTQREGFDSALKSRCGLVKWRGYPAMAASPCIPLFQLQQKLTFCRYRSRFFSISVTVQDKVLDAVAGSGSVILPGETIDFRESI